MGCFPKDEMPDAVAFLISRNGGRIPEVMHRRMSRSKFLLPKVATVSILVTLFAEILQLGGFPKLSCSRVQSRVK